MFSVHGLDIQNASYDPSTGELTLLLTLTKNIDADLLITFNPTKTSRP